VAAPRLLLGENVSPDLADALRQRGVDAIHVSDLRLGGEADEAILAAGARTERAVLTQNVRDFVLLARAYVEHGRHHAGIIVTPQRPLRELLAGVLRLVARTSAADLRDAVRWVP
jgi:predicted nuclease of predicted toxin-antitoxin system